MHSWRSHGNDIVYHDDNSMSEYIGILVLLKAERQIHNRVCNTVSKDKLFPTLTENLPAVAKTRGS